MARRAGVARGAGRGPGRLRHWGARSPYAPVLRHPVLRRVLPGLAVSYLGDGMSYVAIAWLAIELAPPDAQGLWVGAAVAAYSLPGVLGALTLGRWLRGRSGAQLAGWDAVLRGTALAAVPLAALAGVLTIQLFVALLAGSSVLHSWGSAGKYTLLAELLPDGDRLAGNAMMTVVAESSAIAGPVLAGLLSAWHGPTLVIAVDAVTFGVLAATYRLAVPAEQRRDRSTPTRPPGDGKARSAGLSVIRHDARLLGLVVLTFVFYFLYGPVQVALPLDVSQTRGEPATTLGLLWAAFGVGAVVGGLLTGYLRRWSLWRVTIGTVLLWGVSLLPLGLGAPLPWCVAGMAMGGLVYGPYGATSMALFQRSTSPELLPEVLAAQNAVLLVSVPVGAALGGPLVGAIGPQQVLLVSALGTMAVGGTAALLVHRSGRLTRV